MDESINMTSHEDDPLYLNLHDDKLDLSESPILNKTVRKAYYQYLKLLISNNLSSTEPCVSEKKITELAQELELHAIKTCMSSLVYRHIMIQEINNIRSMTASNVSVTKMKLYNSKEFFDFFNTQDMFFEHYNAHYHDALYFECAENVQIKTEEQVPSEDEPSKFDQEDHSYLINENPIPEYVDTHTHIQIKDEISHSKSHKQKVEPLITEQTSNDTEQTNDNDDSNACAPNDTGTVYQRIYEEMSMMFSAEQENSLSDSSTSPSNFFSSSRFFSHEDKHFWRLEAEINKAELQQIISSMYELNKQKYGRVLEKLTEIFGENSIDEKVLPIKKLTRLCKERITWHVKTALTVYYKKKRFRSVDEFRILAKTIVTRLLEINPFMRYQVIYKAIATVFDKHREFLVQNLSHIQYVESKVIHYISNDKS